MPLRNRIAAGLLVVAALSPALGAQGLREVVVDVRITSQALPRALAGSAAVASLTEAIREQAQFQFGYVQWVPLAAGTSAGAPRLVLRVFDGPRPSCGIAAVRLQVSAEIGGAVQWRKLPESDLSEPCDIGVKSWNEADLVDRILRIVNGQFAERSTLDEIQGQLLSNVPLAKALTPELNERRLYLPLTGLLAGKGSRLVVKFGEVEDRTLSMSPIEVRDGRTRVKLLSFSCDSIEFSAGTTPADWSPDLPRLLETCRDPWIYMEVYEPDRASETTSSGLRTQLEEEGEVQP